MNWLHKGLLSVVGIAFATSLTFFVNAQYCEADWGCFGDSTTIDSDPYAIGGYDYGDYISPTIKSPWDTNTGDDYANYKWTDDVSCIKESCNKKVTPTKGGSNGSPSFEDYYTELTKTCSNGNKISIWNDCPITPVVDNTPPTDTSIEENKYLQTCEDGTKVSIYTFCPTKPLGAPWPSNWPSAEKTDPIPSEVPCGYDYDDNPVYRSRGACVQCLAGFFVDNKSQCRTIEQLGYYKCPNGEFAYSKEKCRESVPIDVTTKPGGTVLVNDKNGKAGVIGLYPIVINDWSLYSGWGTSRGTYYNNSSIYSKPIINTVVDTVVTTVTKYECPDGSLVTDRNTCPAGICGNGAIDYPNCSNFKKCSNGATNYPTCDACATGYDLIPVATSGLQRCVAKCDVYSERDTVTGSCKLKACTNGALTAPYCRDCPVGMDMWNGSCVASCPNNQYRTSTGCIEYRCINGATDYPNCGSCPLGKFLQSGGVCKACDTGTSWNGYSCVKNACTNDATNYPECNLCVTGMEYVSAQKKCMYPCPNGYIRNNDGIRCDIINNSCSNYATNIPHCDICPTGYDYILLNKSCTQKCPSGYTRNSNGNCNIDTTTCWNGQTVTINQSCPAQYKYCDNGMMVSANTICPTLTYNPYTPASYTPMYNCNAGYYYNGSSCVQNIVHNTTPVAYNPTPITYNPTPIIYNNNAGGTLTNNTNGNVSIKVCADGTRVALNSNCSIASTGAHKVNTTHVSNISNTSAVCNALANIYAGMPSYGWIEWGTSEKNLNNKTSMQYIGRESVVSYSAPLTGLTPNTLYYCRAVLANNNGTYRGEALPIMTKGQEIKYATAKVEKVTTKNNVKKVTVTTPTYACKDEYGNKATVKGGEKMLTLSIDKSVLSYSKGDKVNYTINYKNTSKVAVKNVELKISLPKEIINIQASKGEIKGNDIILKSDEIGPKSEGVIVINGEVGTLTEGRNVTVAGILAYDIPSKDNLRDEVSAINVGIVKVGDTAPTSAEGKAKVKTNDSFLPNTLIEWSILIIIIFMVIIGFRAWKAKKEDDHH